MSTSSALMVSEPVVSATLAASKRSSEKSMTLMRKEMWRSNQQQQPIVNLRGSVTPMAEKTGFETVCRGTAREVGAPVRRSRCCREAEGRGSAAMPLDPKSGVGKVV